jgi:hypothetical protein
LIPFSAYSGNQNKYNFDLTGCASPHTISISNSEKYS